MSPSSSFLPSGIPCVQCQSRFESNPVTYVANNFVDARTHTLWELDIVEGRWVRVTLDTSIVANLIEFIRRDSRSDVARRQVQDFACKLHCQFSSRFKQPNALWILFACSRFPTGSRLWYPGPAQLRKPIHRALDSTSANKKTKGRTHGGPHSLGG
jgi:hypothetical protein